MRGVYDLLVIDVVYMRGKGLVFVCFFFIKIIFNNFATAGSCEFLLLVDIFLFSWSI